MSLDVIACVGPVTFRSREPETGSLFGFYINDEGFTGWNDGTEIRRNEGPIPHGHGSFDAPGYLSPRVVSISGTCWAESPEQLNWFGSQLTGLLADGESARLVVEQPGEELWAEGRLAGITSFVVRAEDVTSANYQFQMWFADPRKYGETHTLGPVPAGTELEMFHYGNFPASPRFEIAGTVAQDFAVYGPGSGVTRKRYKVNGAVVPGSPNTIDLRTGYTYVNGAPRIGVVEDATSWAVPGGAKVNHMLDANGGAATLSVSITDTYI